MHATPIPLTKLVVSTLNVRKALDAGQEDSNVEELAASIREKGLLSPLTVRPLTDGRFEILVGGKRGTSNHGHIASHCSARQRQKSYDWEYAPY